MFNFFGKFYKSAAKSIDEQINKALEIHNVNRCMERFKKLQDNPSFKNLKLSEKKQAAVLIALCHVNDQLSLLYTVRTLELKRHSGQVSFPGGMLDVNETPKDAALRETEEELGVKQDTVIVLGVGGLLPGRNLAITPVLGYLKETDTNNLNINTKEVKEVFTLPLKEFCKPENCKHTQFREGFSTPVFMINDRKIWGITAFITHSFLLYFIPNLYKFKIPYIKPVYS